MASDDDLKNYILYLQSKPANTVRNVIDQQKFVYTVRTINQQVVQNTTDIENIKTKQAVVGNPNVNDGTLVISDNSSYVIADVFTNLGNVSVGLNSIFSVL